MKPSSWVSRRSKVKPKRQRKPKPVSKPLIGETEDISSGEDFTLNSPSPSNSTRRPSSSKTPKGGKVKTEDEDSHVEARTEDERLLPPCRLISDVKESRKKDSVSKKEKKTKKKDAGPMHFTANSVPRAVEIIGELDPSIFNEVCLSYIFYQCTKLIVNLHLCSLV